MSPIQASPTRLNAQPTRASRNDTPPDRSGLALPYMDHAALRALGSASKHDRSRLEQRLASKTASTLAAVIASLGVTTPIRPSCFDDVAKDIAALDERVAAPLWRQFEHRFICIVENDIDVCVEAEKARLLENMIVVSKRNLPADAQARVLKELTGIVNRSLKDTDVICTALLSLFEHCRDLPVQHRVVPLRNLLLSLPFGSSDAFRPQISRLIDAMRNQIPLFSSEQQASIGHDMHLANTTMEGFFATFASVSALSGQERTEGMSALIGQMLTLDHNYADATVASTLRFFSSPPQLVTAEMLTDLVPLVGQIPNRENRAARLRTIVHLSDAFDADKRSPLINRLAAVAVSLSEPDRKRILVGLYRSVIDMNARDKLETVQRINVLGATIPTRQFAQILVTLPTALQRLVRGTIRTM
jgi:hypothetical protein